MKKKTQPPRNNPVARHAARFQRAQVFRDRSKYRRKAKHVRKAGWSGSMAFVGRDQPVCVQARVSRAICRSCQRASVTMARLAPIRAMNMSDWVSQT